MAHKSRLKKFNKQRRQSEREGEGEKKDKERVCHGYRAVVKGGVLMDALTKKGKEIVD